MSTSIRNLLLKAFDNFKRGDIIVAKKCLNRVLELDHFNFDALFGLGVIEGLHKNYDGALSYFYKAKSKDSQNQDLLYNIAKAHSEQKNYQVAINEYIQLTNINKTHSSAWVNMGLCFYAINKIDCALNCFLNVLNLNPNHFEAHLNLSMIFCKNNLYEKAIYHGKFALSIQPKSFEAHTNIAISLQRMKLHEEAIVHFKNALEINRESRFIFGELVRCRMEMCDWSAFSKDIETIELELIQNNLICQPLTFIGLFDNPELEKRCANIYLENKVPELNNRNNAFKKSINKSKINIGYFSTDFYNHAISYLLVELIEKHDKNKFEIYGFSIGPVVKDEMHERISKAFTNFYDVYNMSDDEIFHLVEKLSIDIAIDLNGFTSGSRTSIFSKKIAPIQINFLGYPGTMGSKYYDYIVADQYVLPDNSQKYFSEKIIYLPNCYQPNDSKKLISSTKFSRFDLQLPDNAFVFCSFNNNYKITIKIFRAWMEILSSVKDSVLWLYQDNPYAVKNLRLQAQLSNIDPQRLIFATKLPLHDHLARHKLADLFLDTYPYNAHTTASDALWTGLPVLTLRGQSFASRVASSLLFNLGLDELVTNSIYSYKHTAIKLAQNPARLNSIREKLSKAVSTSPVFMGQNYANSIENAFTIAHMRFIKGMPLDNIYA